MSILLNKNTSILVQGITGSEGLFHAQQMLDYGSNVVCGVTPGKGGQTATENNLPVFNSIKEAKKEFENKKGKNYIYNSLIGNRKPALNNRN